LFHLASNPTALQRTRNELIARVLELLLFRHDWRVSLTACGRIVAANLRYLREFARPFLIGAVPMLLIFVQLECWFESRPLRVGETAVLEVELEKAYPVLTTPVEISVPVLGRLDSPGVRISARNEIAWRLRATETGAGLMTVRVAGISEQKELTVDQRLVRVSTRRVRAGVWRELFAPSEPPLPEGSPLAGIRIQYPSRELYFRGVQVPWTIAAMVLMMICGAICGRLWGVRVA
jgi:hypothetical protein